MRLKLKLIIGVAILLIVSLVTFYLCKGLSKSKPKSEEVDVNEVRTVKVPPKAIIEGITLNLPGKKQDSKITLTAKRAIVKDGTLLFPFLKSSLVEVSNLYGVEIEISYRKGEKIILKAPRGLYSSKNGTIKLWNKVEIKENSKFILIKELMLYPGDIIEIKKPFRIITASFSRVKKDKTQF